MDKKISTDQIIQLAEEFNIDYKLIKAVLIVEASNSGFDPRTGKIKIQFEPHWFEKYTRTKILNGVEVQSAEWEAYNKAAAIDSEKAMLSTSWGMGQIMGFNYGLAGYKSVQAMVNEFQLSEYFQVKGMLNFIKNTGLLRYLKAKDWRAFAKGYNGKNYEKFDYHNRLEKAYKKLI